MFFFGRGRNSLWNFTNLIITCVTPHVITKTWLQLSLIRKNSRCAASPSGQIKIDNLTWPKRKWGASRPDALFRAGVSNSMFRNYIFSHFIPLNTIMTSSVMMSSKWTFFKKIVDRFLPLGKEGYCNHNVWCLSVCPYVNFSCRMQIFGIGKG